MRIPEEVKVGRHRYKIQQVKYANKANTMGSVDYDTRTIYVARWSHSGRRYTRKEMYDTFWHELTHAILKDMGSQLESSENFVTAFANRLTNAITTAKFQ